MLKREFLQKIEEYNPNYDMDMISRAYDVADEMHRNQLRKSGEEYLIHPVAVAEILADLGMDSETIAAGLLHDVIEDCHKEDGSKYVPGDLPVNDEARKIVALMTCPKRTPETRDEVLTAYYEALATYPKAALVKLIDRCNNLTTMSWGLPRWKIYRMIRETEKYYPTLMKVLKETPEYNDAAWLLKYQMDSTIDVYKRLM